MGSDQWDHCPTTPKCPRTQKLKTYFTRWFLFASDVNCTSLQQKTATFLHLKHYLSSR